MALRFSKTWFPPEGQEESLGKSLRTWLSNESCKVERPCLRKLTLSKPALLSMAETEAAEKQKMTDKRKNKNVFICPPGRGEHLQEKGQFSDVLKSFLWGNLRKKQKVMTKFGAQIGQNGSKTRLFEPWPAYKVVSFKRRSTKDELVG